MDYCYRIYQRVLDILYASQKYLMNSVSKQCELISIIKFLTKAIKLTLNEIVENLFQTINQFNCYGSQNHKNKTICFALINCNNFNLWNYRMI